MLRQISTTIGLAGMSSLIRKNTQTTGSIKPFRELTSERILKALRLQFIAAINK